ncbi:chromodomain-helicase-DNA-binding protein 6 isoform X2 [Protopterus annectens]|nr:chromodomain-helicase-DNA-binding protein 6 isoform X2 [Protopterus annectens]
MHRSYSLTTEPPDERVQSLYNTKKDQQSLPHRTGVSDVSGQFVTLKDHAPREPNAVIPKGWVTINGIDNSASGGTTVKKKCKKRDVGAFNNFEKGTREKEIKPKRKREEAKEALQEREPKKLKSLKGPKKPRKPREAKLTKEKTSVDSVTKIKGKKTSKDQCSTPTEKKKKGKRKSEIPVDVFEMEQSPPGSPSQDADESLESADGQKRRSGRQVKRRRYNEDLDFKVVDDDGETIAVLGPGRASALSASTLAWQAEEPPEDDANIIEKILTSRILEKECPDEPSTQVEQVEEFFVKYRNFSYLHCKWATMEELEKDPRIHQKIKRFRTKQMQMKNIFTEPDEDLFNPDYVEVDRILDIAQTTDPDTGEEVIHYLVKWCSLPYEESTWELEEDVDPVKIKEYKEIQIIPNIKRMERPASDLWQKLVRTRDYKNNNQLRDYQLEGMNWLLFNWYNRKNCVLADEMGLGKTIQSITFLYEIFMMGIRGPFLIIAPLSTITNWEREFRTWTEMNVIVYHGSLISRQMIHQYEMVHRDEQGSPVLGLYKFHVIITTFEMILADCPELRKIHWSCVVIDEAHRLKNRNCKLLEGLKLMTLEHKVLLTGTPLQNSVEELFSLLNFLEPNQFPSETAFLEEFGDLKTDEQVKKLQAILKPMMLRRLKDDVEKNLAPKEETIIEVELTNIQKKYYRAILEKNFTFLAKGANQHNMPNLINTMMELRKCCNHPYLINGAEEKILEDFRKTYDPESNDFQLQAMIQAAGKLVLIDKLLPKLIAGGHKVLIFSQMVRCLDILEDYLIQRRYTYERIDGRVRGNLRQAAIDRFCKPDSDRFVFLLCTRAGGLGINLTAADTCIIFDSDWNPQNDLQAQARCHRIGQSKAVKVYRLITRNSYEREMFDKASLKLGLDRAVLQDINRKGNTNGVQQLSKLEVEDLLRKGAYGALMDEEDEGSKFCEEDIDQILQRRTQTITIQCEGKGSTFAKASFVASGNRTDISLDDPNFWQKWAKIAELDMDSKAEKDSLVIDRPRVRKQTKHYNSFEEDELMEFSELDSDSDERPSRTRRMNERARRYLRAECFRVEKNLLIFGWGRWKDILTHGRFKWHLNEKDMEVICRALLVYCLKHYKGDEKIKSFIWDLITPTKDGQNQALQNHSGLSAPVPRGRKGKKLKNPMLMPDLKNADWLVSCNPEIVLQDDSYKKHLKQHCNKVLLRVRMLYYLRVEVLGDVADKALEGCLASDLDFLLPDIDYLEIPAEWWDANADKSLLIGVFKHGYERYSAIRADPALGFLEKVGMPDIKHLSTEQEVSERSSAGREDGAEYSNEACLEENTEEETNMETLSRQDENIAAQDSPSLDRLCWPVSSALTARLRRLITAYQRFNRKELIRAEFSVPGNIGYWYSQEEMFRRVADMDPFIKEMQKRWTRREQADFYRTVSSFGVVYDAEAKLFDWSRFRTLSRLEKKTDESLEKYFYSFVAMCRNVCRLPPRKDDGPPDPSIYVEPITEERAARTLYRIELLRKIREQVLRHPQLIERLKLCRPSLYLPVWWECGKHDRDLLIGAARHGLSRTDYYIMNDASLSFLDAYRNYSQKESTRRQDTLSPCCLYQAGLGHCDSPGPYHMQVQSERTPRTSMPLRNSVPLSKLSEVNVPETVKDESSINECNLQDADCETLSTESKGVLSSSPEDDEEEEEKLDTECLCIIHDKTISSGAGSDVNNASIDEDSLSAIDNQSCTNINVDNAESSVTEFEPVNKMQFSCSPSDTPEVPHDLDSRQTACGRSDQVSEKSDPPISVKIDIGDSSEGSHEGIFDSLSHGEPPCLNMDITLAQLEDEDSSNMKSTTVGDVQIAYNTAAALLDEMNDPLQDEALETSDLFEDDHGLRSEETPIDCSFKKETIMEVPDEMTCSSFTRPGCKNVLSESSIAEGKDCTLTDLEGEMDYSHSFKTDDASDLFREHISDSLGMELLSDLEKETEGLHAGSSEEKFSFESCLLDKDNIKQEMAEVDLLKDKNEVKDGSYLCEVLSRKPPEEDSKSSTVAPCVARPEDFLQDPRAPTIAQLLQEKTLYSFSEWPKDRVIINRIDNICHAILKGKWPSSSQQFDAQYMNPSPNISNNIGFRNSYPSNSMHSTHHLGFNHIAPVTHIQKESFLNASFPRDLRRSARCYQYEAERNAKQRSLEEITASHGRPPVVLNGWQDTAIDLSRASELSPSPPSFHSTNIPKMGSVSSLHSSLGMDLSGILQAGLIHPVTGQIVNGNFRREDAAVRRRKGRRRNVEGLDPLFLKDHNPSSQIQNGLDEQKHSQNSIRPDRHSSITPTKPTEATSKVQPEKDVANRSLLEWLRQHPDYTMDVPGFSSNMSGILQSFSEKPKQRRQRCKDPSKLDINTLTGEERVPVVHKGTGRRLGGAMAPAIRELPRWLDANPEYAVAPDWADIVKLSGFLPENKFNRILTEPVLKDPGQRRRGRRPRSEMIKAAGVLANAASPVGPLFMNGLISGMDLVGLQNMRNMQSIPLTGLVGFPAGFAAVSTSEEAKNSLNMLPMMLPGQMFGVGGFLNPSLTTACTSTSPTLASTTKSSTSNTEKNVENKQGVVDAKKANSSEDKVCPVSSSFSDCCEPTVTNSNPVAFNPFLIPGMSPGLIYPSMFLSPGLNVALSGLQHGRHSDAANADGLKRKKKKMTVKEEEPVEDSEAATNSGDADKEKAGCRDNDNVAAQTSGTTKVEQCIQENDKNL